ncbi:hypothetical protein [Hansschlegelia plantiphila]|uniref:hypothetical protein n=1 Tax=Hansschlegelia plantiphila TaxID=374655 RepID=UPI0022F247AB|nr:hypothetical protein [Hansschlegelia plantiphila]
MTAMTTISAYGRRLFAGLLAASVLAAAIAPTAASAGDHFGYAAAASAVPCWARSSEAQLTPRRKRWCTSAAAGSSAASHYDGYPYPRRVRVCD